MDEMDLPDPLTPADCDLRDFPFMPLLVERLRRSKAWLMAKRQPELAFYMINLWTAAWHDFPSGSLEDDDDVLADLAMCDPRQWPKIRDKVRRGWVKCSDGRLYHPVVAEQACKSWAERKGYRERLSKARAAKSQRRDAEAYDTDHVTERAAETTISPVTGSIIDDVTGHITALKGQGQGQGQGEKRREESPLTPQSGESNDSHSEGKRGSGTNPRATGTNPRAVNAKAERRQMLQRWLDTLRSHHGDALNGTTLNDVERAYRTVQPVTRWLDGVNLGEAWVLELLHGNTGAGP